MSDERTVQLRKQTFYALERRLLEFSDGLEPDEQAALAVLYARATAPDDGSSGKDSGWFDWLFGSGRKPPPPPARLIPIDFLSKGGAFSWGGSHFTAAPSEFSDRKGRS